MNTRNNIRFPRMEYILTIVSVFITIILFLVNMFGIMLPDFHQGLEEKKQETLIEITNIAWNLLNFYEDQVQKNILTREEAQLSAIMNIRNMRYGNGMKYYFWINDMHPKMIMHPYRSELEGKDLTYFKEYNEKNLFLEAVEKVSQHGEGIITYKWQWNDNPGRIVPKISFVKKFEPWGWIIGSGMYIDSIEEEINFITRKTKIVSTIILSLVFLIMLYIMRYNMKINKIKQETESSLLRSEERFRELVELLPEIIFELDVQGNVIFVNSNGLKKYGYTHNEFEKGISYLSFIIFEDRERTRRDMARILSGKDIGIREYSALAKDGTVFPVMTRAMPIVRDGKTIGIRGILVDISDRKRAEEETERHRQQLIRADKMTSLGILVSGVAHEINNPNNYIMLNGKMLMKVWDDVTPILTSYYNENGDFLLAGIPYSIAGKKIKQLIKGIPDGANRIKKIVQSLKEFARNDTGTKSDNIDINNVVESAVTIANNLIKKTTKHFTVIYGENIPAITGNSQQLEQVIINLLTNACQALQKIDSCITIVTSYRSETNEIIVKVTDEGVGISPHHMPHIMDPFFTTKRSNEGTGLGLSISYNFIKDHNGDLRIVSEIGKGTKAIISLPAVLAGTLTGACHETVSLSLSSCSSR